MFIDRETLAELARLGFSIIDHYAAELGDVALCAFPAEGPVPCGWTVAMTRDGVSVAYLHVTAAMPLEGSNIIVARWSPTLH